MKQAKTLTPEELQQVLDALQRKPHASRNRALLLMTHLAGLRVGELAALRWADAVDTRLQVGSEIRLSAAQTKGRAPRTVYVSPKLQAELQAYVHLIGERPPLWALFYTQKHPQRGFTANTLTQHFRCMYRNAGMEGASSHSGRRTFATQLSSKGAPIRVLMRLMGHQHISTTIGYVDASDDMLRQAVTLA